MPVYFNINNPICEKNLGEQSELIIILPCHEGEEREYAENDPFLRKLISEDDEMRNFLSSMSAKGLEFQRVVLYKFGSACYHDYPKLLEPLVDGKVQVEDREKSLPLEYFMNRLYVATSRAKKRLIIVDDTEGLKTLWNNEILKSIDSLMNKYDSAKKNGWAEDFINYVQEGFDQNWLEERDDPIKLGDLLHEAGIYEKDPYKLKLAAANFRRGNKHQAALQCDAERYEIENNFIKAAQIYLKLKDTKKALRCFWIAESFADILNQPDFTDTIEQRAASFMISSKSEAECTKFFDFICDEVKGGSRSRVITDQLWTKIIDHLLDNFKDVSAHLNWQKIYQQVKELQGYGVLAENRLAIANIAYNAKEFTDAVAIWETLSISLTKEIKYKKAKAFTTSYPERIKWLAEIGNHDEIVKSWSDNRGTRLDFDQAHTVTASLMMSKKYTEALTLLERYPNESLLEKLFDEVQKNEPGFHKSVAKKLLVAKIKKNQWKEAVNFIDKATLKNGTKKELMKILTYEIAKSTDFTAQTSLETKNVVGLFLKKKFIDEQWEDLVPVMVAGAAIERAYKIIDSLEFYETVWKTGRVKADAITIENSKERWIRCKLRQAEISQDKGKTHDAGRQREEAESIANKLGINKDKIADYPSLEFDESIYSGDLIQQKEQHEPVNMKQVQIALLYRQGVPVKDIAKAWGLTIKEVEEAIKKDNNTT
jgi:hypothetical protein